MNPVSPRARDRQVRQEGQEYSITFLEPTALEYSKKTGLLTEIRGKTYYSY